MKNFLEYYYDFLNITVHEKDKYYYIDYNNNIYLFMPTIRNVNEINAIYLLSNNLIRYHKIILNKTKSPITILNNKPYVLLKLSNVQNDISKSDLLNDRVTLTRNNSILLRNDWVNLLEKKIDYIEYQRIHFNNKYELLDSTLDYYIGMAENAIAYINSTNLSQKKSYLDDLIICHRRIKDSTRFSFYNPLDLIIDHPSREVSEYLKIIFLKDMYDINILNDIFTSLTLSEYGYRLLFGRMLYPSFYFDEYEKIINENSEEKEILKIIKRQKEYENYLNMIYKFINQKNKIPSIDWI